MTAPTSPKSQPPAQSLCYCASCANTIRGMGRDTANAVNATQAAGHSVKKAAQLIWDADRPAGNPIGAAVLAIIVFRRRQPGYCACAS